MNTKAMAEAAAEGAVIQTAILIAEPGQVNRILAELSGVNAIIQSVQPIFMGIGAGKYDIIVTFTVEHEGPDAQFAFLSWVEETLAPFCKVY